MNMQEETERLRHYREIALQGGGEDKVVKQQKKGKLFARDRVRLLLDEGSFIEIGMFAGHDFLTEEEKTFGDGLITGGGKVDGRKVYILAHDSTIYGGSVGTIGRSKYCGLLDTATQHGVPFIGLMDSPGARIGEIRRGAPQHGFLRHQFFKRHAIASGVIPQIAAILGTCAGNATYAPALCDFIIMVEGISNMFITGPNVIKEVTGEDVTIPELGGPQVHCRKSGVADFRVKTEEECFQLIRKLLSFLPQNCREKPPRVDTGDDPNRFVDVLEEIVPTDRSKAYDVRRVIRELADRGEFLEVQADFGQNAVVGFARLNGQTVGFSCSQPLYLAGAIDVNSSDKQSKFIRFCDAFNIPIIFLIDTPGYLPGLEQEYTGIIRHGAKMLYAIAEATVPKVGVRLRKAVGGASAGSGGRKDLGVDWMFSWPMASPGAISPEGAAKILFREEIARAENPDEFLRQKIEELRRMASGPYEAAAIEEVDEIIELRETRQRLITALELMADKVEPRPYRKHGLMPV
ncbi:acyl-CoA carboxylase subunit beta [Chloroflexota bacterium]